MPIYAHGTPQKYRAGCRCNLCELVHARYDVPAEVEKAARIDATPARERINALRAAGWTVQAIADRAGYHEGTIRSISVGRWKQSSRFTVEDICSIPLEDAAA